jgi:hypothetical protein
MENNISQRSLIQVAEELSKLADQANALSLEAIQINESLNIPQGILPEANAIESMNLIQQIESSILISQNFPSEISKFRKEFISPLESEAKQDPTIKKISDFRKKHVLDRIEKTYETLTNDRDVISIAVRELFDQELQSVFIVFCKEVSSFESFMFKSKQELLGETELEEDPWIYQLIEEKFENSVENALVKVDNTQNYIIAQELTDSKTDLKQVSTELADVSNLSQSLEQGTDFYSKGTVKGLTTACLTPLLKLNSSESAIKNKCPDFFNLSAQEKRDYLVRTERLYDDFFYAIRNFKIKLTDVRSSEKLINTIISKPQYLLEQPRNYGTKFVSGERVLETWNLALTFWFSNDNNEVNNAVRSLIKGN